MRGLAGSRVLLIDDNASEALPIIKAFSRAGVPVAYFDGSSGEPTATRRLKGVRLAILDMNLGIPGTDENIASTLVQTLSRIMSPENGPYGVLIWTGHPDLKAVASRYLFQHPSLPKPVFVEMLKKANFSKTLANGTKKFAMAKLSKELTRVLSEHSPLECFQSWEGASFTAATNVTNGVAEFSGGAAASLEEWKTAWSSEALKLLLALGKAQAESKLTDLNCVPSVFLALNPLHLDRLDALAAESSQGLSHHVQKIMTATGASAVARKAKVNSMLHLASDNLDEFSSGNLYVFARGRRAPFMPSLKELAADCAEGSGESHTANANRLRTGARMCGIEITPSCDHAQGKLGLSRVLCGLVLPPDLETAIKKKAGFLKRVGPLLVEGGGLAPSPYYLYLNSRFVASAMPTQVSRLTARARVRAQLLSDIQSWSAYQGARQGYTIV